MKIVIFGASGATGRYLVEQALEQRHEVIAFVRNPSKLQIKHEKLSTIKGDVRNQEDVNRAIAGGQAVLSALGVKPGVKPVSAEGVRNIIFAMKKHHVHRLIVESAFGAGDTKKGFYGRTLWFIINPLMRDKEDMESAIEASGLDWTIVRPTALTNGKKTGSYQSGVGISVGIFPKISRADVADFMLKQLTDKRYLSKASTITG